MRWSHIAVLCAVTAAGCGPGGPDDADASSAAEWLASVGAAHERADAALAAAEPDRARSVLGAAFERDAPPAVRRDHARAVRQDLAFRLADLELERGQPQLALRYADRGLALGRGEDLFTANLLAARGRALSRHARREFDAARSFLEALELNERLLRAVLATSDGGAP